MEVSLRIHKSYRDQREAQITRFLAVIAGQNPKASSIDGQGLVKGKFSGKVSYRAIGEIGESSGPPRLLSVQSATQTLNRSVVKSNERRLPRRLLKTLVGHRIEHPHRIVRS